MILYSTSACHLCEMAEELLDEARSQGAPIQFEKVDIVDDDALMERYGVRIPVLRRRSDNAELGWPFDAVTLHRWLQG
nr:glutaredoxin family protein [Litorivivens lipolytica]